MNALTFLGTGTSSGVPFIGCDCDVCTSKDPKDNRLRSSVLVQSANSEILIDSGPDLRQQLLQHTPKAIDAIFYTHEHRDHTAGLDDVRPYYFKQKKDIKLFGNADVEKSLKRDYHYAFGDKVYPGAPSFDYRCIGHKETIAIGNLQFQPLDILHGRLDILGYKIGDALAYITDASSIPGHTMDALKGLDVLIVNALRIETHHSHFNLEEAIEISRKIGAKHTYFTHISHLLGTHVSVQASLPENVTLAYDGLKINF
jgi:phosphoribosyl 1,2-cyclic phosphate phosphodiesterase